MRVLACVAVQLSADLLSQRQVVTQWLVELSCDSAQPVALSYSIVYLPLAHQLYLIIVITLVTYQSLLSWTFLKELVAALAASRHHFEGAL